MRNQNRNQSTRNMNVNHEMSFQSLPFLFASSQVFYVFFFLSFEVNKSTNFIP